MEDIYRRAKEEAGCNATAFRRMVAEHGGLEMARRLINANKVSDGYTALWERGRLAGEEISWAPEERLVTAINACYADLWYGACVAQLPTAADAQPMTAINAFRQDAWTRQDPRLATDALDATDDSLFPLCAPGYDIQQSL